MVFGGDDLRSYIQEERQDGHKCVGAARQQGEGSAAVHPQRVIPLRRDQSEKNRMGKKTNKKHKQQSMSPPAAGKMHSSMVIILFHTINAYRSQQGLMGNIMIK